MYQLTEDKTIIENQEYVVYGIKCDECCIKDISADKDMVEKLIEKFNKYELLPEHLYDAVTDELQII